jgi:hypothetical protein
VNFFKFFFGVFKKEIADADSQSGTTQNPEINLLFWGEMEKKKKKKSQNSSGIEEGTQKGR